MSKEYPSRPTITVDFVDVKDEGNLITVTGAVYNHPEHGFGEKITTDNIIGLTKYGELKTESGHEIAIVGQKEVKSYVYATIDTVEKIKSERSDPRLSKENKEKYLTTQEREELPEWPTKGSKKSQVQLIESRRTREDFNKNVTYKNGKEVKDND